MGKQVIPPDKKQALQAICDALAAYCDKYGETYLNVWCSRGSVSGYGDFCKKATSGKPHIEFEMQDGVFTGFEEYLL